jgi:LysR family transcriptional regulator, regulator for bpeEF and oprC
MDKLRAMQYFVQVTERRSLSAAARALDVMPSTVSRVITGLEDRIGFPLFQRSTRHLSLTPNGELYLERCRSILQAVEDADNDAKRQGDVPRGTIKVGLHPVFRIAFFSELGSFLETYPELRIETKITNSPSVLLDEGFEVLIRVGDLPDSTLVARKIGLLEFVVVASPRYLKRHGIPRSPADLTRHRMALPARLDDASSSVNWDFFKDGERCTIRVPGYVMARDGMGLPEAVIGGGGIARLYRIALMHAITQGLVTPLLTEWTSPAHPVYAVFASAHAITPKTKALVDFVCDIVARSQGQSKVKQRKLLKPRVRGDD